MSDQAHKLRQLVQEAAHGAIGASDVPLIVIGGGHRGVGTSTVALQLALACQRRKLKTILVDTSFRQTSFYATSRAKGRDTLIDVLSGGRTVAEVLYSGSHGVQILPGAELPPALADISAKSWGRIVGQLRSLQSPADLILFDTGAGAPSQTAPLWQVANYVVLVASTEPVSVMDTYATLKAAVARSDLPKTGIVMNRANDDAEAISARIASAARKFLNLEVDILPAIPLASELAGGTADSCRLHKDSAPRNAFGALAEHIRSRVHPRTPEGERQRAA